MEGTKELPATVISLHKAGKKPMDIFWYIKSFRVSHNFMYYTIKRYKETNSLKDRQTSGRPRSIRTIANIKKVRERLRRNPCRTQKKLGLQTNISRVLVNRILKYDLKVKAYSQIKVHFLNERMRKLRRYHYPVLLKRHDARKILFTDEKIFTVGEKFNRQNNKLYVNSSKGVRASARYVFRYASSGERDGQVGSFVWWCHSASFLPTRSQRESKKLQVTFWNMLWNPCLILCFITKKEIFQQDSAPAHKAKPNQAWLRVNLPGFIAEEERPSSRPDLNLLTILCGVNWR